MRVFGTRLLCLFVLSLGFANTTGAEVAGLSITAKDVVMEPRADGYHLFIRKLPGIQSILLTESFELPDHRLSTYALRTIGTDSVNQSERRLLNGQFLKEPHRSIVSSTGINYPGLGEAFHVLITPEIEYGNQVAQGARYQRINVAELLRSADKSFWFSIRAFAKPYADYAGPYQDNAFEFKSFAAQVSRPASDGYAQGLAEDFGRLGTPYRASGIQDALSRIVSWLSPPADSLDMVIAIDTTKSMVQNLKIIQSLLVAPLRDGTANYRNFQIGLVFYRDYLEDYLTRVVPFTRDWDQLQKDLDRQTAEGGGDAPEAVVEAMWAGLNSFRWTASRRVLLVVGDAPQHPIPRGDVTETQVRDLAHSLGVQVEMLMLPQGQP